MKTFKTIIVTFMVTMIVAAVGVFAVLLNLGIVTINERDVNHTKTVMVDGVVTETTNWTETLGVEVSIDVVDGLYIDFN